MYTTVRLMSLIPTDIPVSDMDTSTDPCVEVVQADVDTSEGIQFISHAGALTHARTHTHTITHTLTQSHSHSQRNGTPIHQKSQVVYNLKSLVLILSTMTTGSWIKE